MKVAEERIHDGHVSRAAQEQAAASLIMGRAMHPHSIKDDVVCRALVFRSCQKNDTCLGRFAADFDADKAIVIRAVVKKNRARGFARKNDLRHHIVGGSAVKIGTAGKRSHACKAGREPRAFRWQRRVGSAGADDDPVRVVTGLLGEQEFARESGARFQFESVATCGVIDRVLQVAPGFHGENLPGRGRIGKSAFYMYAWQLGGTVELGWVGTGGRRCRLAGSRLNGQQGDEQTEQHPNLT